MIELRTIRKWFPSGIYPLDLGFGKGMPLGHIIELMGDEKVGKTALLLHLVKQIYNHSKDNLVYYLENEVTLYADRVIQVGVDWERLKDYIIEFNTLEETFAFIENVLKGVCLAREQGYKGIVGIFLDTLTAGSNLRESNPKKQVEYLKAHRATNAAICKEFFRRDNMLIARAEAMFIVANQVTYNVNCMFGDPRESSGGGKGLAFFESGKLDMTKKRKHFQKTKNRIGHEVEKEIGFQSQILTKNIKTGGKNGRLINIDVYYETGVDPDSAIFYALQEGKYTKTSGSQILYEGKQLKRAEMKEFMDKNPQLTRKIKQDLEEYYR
uniref:Putative RecA n=1 Tax=viral metagenome TaxID=1070528 RepID=A0A6M3L654_9ZZZZ